MQEMAGKGVEVIIGCAPGFQIRAHRHVRPGRHLRGGAAGRDLPSGAHAYCQRREHDPLHQDLQHSKGGARNPPSDLAAIRECILRVSTLVDHHPEISELDINPLIVYPEGRGAVVADCRIMLRDANN